MLCINLYIICIRNLYNILSNRTNFDLSAELTQVISLQFDKCMQFNYNYYFWYASRWVANLQLATTCKMERRFTHGYIDQIITKKQNSCKCLNSIANNIIFICRRWSLFLFLNLQRPMLCLNCKEFAKFNFCAGNSVKKQTNGPFAIKQTGNYRNKDWFFNLFVDNRIVLLSFYSVFTTIVNSKNVILWGIYNLINFVNVSIRCSCLVPLNV